MPDITTKQICPENRAEGAAEVTTAYPDGWYVRIMFDELLDPDIETLTAVTDDTGMETGTFKGSVADANPVTLRCQGTSGTMVTVPYDGYYSPAGNRITWPLGPSLVIKPNNPTLIATNATCEVTINDSVTDKEGTVVDAGQRGPFTFRIAPIQVIAIDPADDPEFKPANAIDATQIWVDNPYVHFNTTVDLATVCPDAGGDGYCDNEAVFAIRDVEHPMEGPGKCNVSGAPCGTLADCPAGMNDTVCGRGYCTDAEDMTNGGSFTPCNKASDCTAPDDACGTNGAYRYDLFGLTPSEFGINPANPIQTERKYVMEFTAGAKLKDRCGRETTLGMSNAEALSLARFMTTKFGPRATATSIVTGETSSANKRLQFNFTNVLAKHDTASGAAPVPANPDIINVAAGEFTISPMPQKLTGACAPGGAGCPVTDLTPAELLIIPADGSGQISVQGHYKLNTEYTATLKAGTVIEEFYGKTYTVPTNVEIKWKTQPAIQMTGITVRNTGQLFGVGDKATLTRPTAMTTTDIRLAFNASMDPTTLDLSDIEVTPAVNDLAVVTPSGCGTVANATGYLGTCTLRLRGTFATGKHKITLKAGAAFKDIYGTAYSQTAAQSIEVTVENAKPTPACL